MRLENSGRGIWDQESRRASAQGRVGRSLKYLVICISFCSLILHITEIFSYHFSLCLLALDLGSYQQKRAEIWIKLYLDGVPCFILNA